MTLLSVEQLVVDVQPPGTGTRVPIIQDVGFTLSAGETMALVGESGSGKSMTALAIMGLLPEPVVQRVSGRILLGDRELTNLAPREMASVRGTGIGMIFQEPMTALNPVYSIGEQVSEVLRHHRGMGHAEARIETIRLLGRVDLPDPAARYCAYPHEFSGGMRQRVLVAMAIAAKPSLVIADEPTTALDVRTQRGVLDLLQSLVIEDGMGLLLITHDMALVGERSDRLCVLCQGRICEMGPTRRDPGASLAPLHPGADSVHAHAACRRFKPGSHGGQCLVASRSEPPGGPGSGQRVYSLVAPEHAGSGPRGRLEAPGGVQRYRFVGVTTP